MASLNEHHKKLAQADLLAALASAGVIVDAPTLSEPYAYEVQWAEAGTDCAKAEFQVLPPRDPGRYEKVTRLFTEAQVRALLTPSQPLTSEKLFTLLMGCSEHPPARLPPGYVAFARAVEAAHGIGVEASDKGKP